MAGGGGSSGKQTVEPWGGQKGYLSDVFRQGQDLSGRVLDYYPGQLVASQSADTVNGINAMRQQAMAGSPILTAAQDATTNVMQGSNPALGMGQSIYNGNPNEALGLLRGQYSLINPGSLDNPAYRRMAASTIGDVNQEMEGAMGSSARAAMMNDSLTNLAAQNYQNDLARQQSIAGQIGDLSNQDVQNRLSAAGLVGQTYSSDQQAKLAAAGLAPTLMQAKYIDPTQLLSLGAIEDQYSQSQIDADKAKYDYAMMEPWQRLNLYSGLVGGMNWGSSTSIGGGMSPGQGALQGAIGGAAAGTAVSPGWGTLIGAGVGALGGYAGAR